MPYASLTTKHGLWQRADLRSGGLLDWAMHGIGIGACDDVDEGVWPTRALVSHDAAPRTIEGESGEEDDSMRDSDDDADAEAGQFANVPKPVSPPVCKYATTIMAPVQVDGAFNAPAFAAWPPARQTSGVRKLTHEDAVSIYLARLGPKTPRMAMRLAAEFGVTAKAVRDLWTLRTWAKSTEASRLLLAHNDYMPPGMQSLKSLIAEARVKRALHATP